MDKPDTYSGTGSVEDFLEKITRQSKRLWWWQKDTMLSIEIIRRSVPGLYADDKTDYNKLETELSKEFNEGTSNREAALDESSPRYGKGKSSPRHGKGKSSPRYGNGKLRWNIRSWTKFN